MTWEVRALRTGDAAYRSGDATVHSVATMALKKGISSVKTNQKQRVGKHFNSSTDRRQGWREKSNH